MNFERFSAAALAAFLMVFAATVSAVPFDLKRAVLGPIEESRTFFGTVEAINQARVTAQTSGRVTEILADIDDYVEQGQVILQLNNTTQQAAVNAAKASLSEARVFLADSEKEYDRIQEIYSQGLISKSVADKTTAQLDAARARVKTAEAGLNNAQENLEYTKVRAPFAGIVMQRHVDIGEIANPGMPLFTGLSLDHLRVVSWIPQSIAHQVDDVSLIRVTSDSGVELPVSTLTRFPYADPKTHSVKIRVDVDAADQILYPGMYVNLKVATGIRDAVLIPESAVVQRREVTAVYQFGPGNQVRLKQIKLGRRQGELVEVLSGISEGDQVATDPISAGIYLKEILSGGDL